MKKYPVVFFIFRRPESTARVLKEIIKSNPPKLYIFADAARNEAEETRVAETRRIVDKLISDVKFPIIRSYRSRNCGLKHSIVEGLNCVFSIESAAIILEDDCLPNVDFFNFTRVMLDKYQADHRVYSITGTSFGYRNRYSYDFSKYQSCWGWATWADRWTCYDSKLTKITGKFWKTKAKQLWPNYFNRLFWHSIYKVCRSNIIDTWDYQWSFSHFINNGLAIIPSSNLVINLGFDESATNTKTQTKIMRNRLESLSGKIKHPKKISESSILSSIIEQHYYKSIVAVVGLFIKYLYLLKRQYVDRN